MNEVKKLNKDKTNILPNLCKYIKNNKEKNLKIYNLIFKHKSIDLKKTIFIIIIIMVNFPIIVSFEHNYKWRKLNLNSIITLKIKGNGNHYILNNETINDNYIFKNAPSEVIINNVSQNYKTTFDYELNSEENTIIMKWDYSLTNCDVMFYNLTNIINIDLSKFDTSKVTSMHKMFSKCKSLTSLNLNNLDTSKVLDMEDIFFQCTSLKNLDLSTFSTASVISMMGMFHSCNSLVSLDLSNFDTSKVTNMYGMFNNCSNLKSLNLNNFVTSSVKNMNGLFYDCIALTSLDLSSFDTSSVITMNGMFKGCNSLLYLDLNNFDTSKVTDMSSMFLYCTSLISLNIISFNTSSVYSMKKMFKNCTSLISLNLNGFDTSKLNSLDEMFLNCNNALIYCINNISKISTIISNYSPNYKNNCSDICFFPNIKLTEENICVINCKDINKYEYNNICYNSCPNDTFYYLENLCLSQEDMSSDTNDNTYQKGNNTNNIFTILKKIIKELNSNSFNLLNNSKDLLISEFISNGKKDILYQDDDISFQITSTENQNNNEYINISTIKLGECESKLKNHYKINNGESLVILKIEYYKEGLLIPIIEYEIYHPITKKKLDLNICNDTKIELLIPVSIDEDDLFKYNLSSEYYNDICYPYTAETGTDIILQDRRNEYIDNNMSLCEDNCEYKGYNLNNKKVSCECQSKLNINAISEFKIDKDKLLNNLNIKNLINIEILKCFKLLFSKEGIIKNIGSYILLLIIIINILLSILFILKGYHLLYNQIIDLLDKIKINQIKKNNNINFEKRKIQKSTTFNRKNKRKKSKNSNLDKDKSKSSKKKLVSKNAPPKNKKSKGNNIFIHEYRKSSSNSKLQIIGNTLINDKKTLNDNNHHFLKNNDEMNKNSNKSLLNIKLNDYEINDLDYKTALKKDKRNFIQYYISLLKRKQLIIFTFFVNDDYNSKIIKISSFLFSFVFYYVVNALFFNDETMHKIYEDEGTFNFIYQLPQILYSTIISSAISFIVKFLSLSEKDILKLKGKEKENIQEKSKRIITCLNIKFIIYFIIDFFFLIFFWYYLGCFCAVYKNTQIHLIKDTSFSFLLSLLYPLILSLLPGLFRIPALSAPKKDKECTYKLSKIVQII